MHKNVSSVTNVLKNEVVNLLEGIYSTLEWIGGMIANTPLIGGKARFSPLSKENRVLAGAETDRRYHSELALRMRAGQATSPEDQKRIKKDIETQVLEEFRRKSSGNPPE